MVARTATRPARKSASVKPAAAKTTRTRTAKSDPAAEMIAEFVGAISDGSLDGHLAVLDAALTERANASGAAKRTRSTAAAKTGPKPAAKKTAASAKLSLDTLEKGTTYAVVPGTQRGDVDISNQRVTFVRVAKKAGQSVAKVNLNGTDILLPASSLTTVGRGRPPRPVDL